METGISLYYDGSFEGFLTAVSFGLENGWNVAEWSRTPVRQSGLFTDYRTIRTDRLRAEKTWDCLDGLRPGMQRMVYFGFLSDKPGRESVIYDLLYPQGNPVGDNGADSVGALRKLQNWAHGVAMEKARLEARIGRLAETGDSGSLALAPEHDVLPLLSRHMRNRCGLAAWLLYDRKRNYGIAGRGERMQVLRLPAWRWKRLGVMTDGTAPRQTGAVAALRTAV